MSLSYSMNSQEQHFENGAAIVSDAYINAGPVIQSNQGNSQFPNGWASIRYNADLPTPQHSSAILPEQNRSKSTSHKRARTQYTSQQLMQLEKQFHTGRYLCRAKRIQLSQSLELTEKQIKVWFQNRRMKYKKDNKVKNSLVKQSPDHSSGSSEVRSPTSSLNDIPRILNHQIVPSNSFPIQQYPSTAGSAFHAPTITNQWINSTYNPLHISAEYPCRQPPAYSYPTSVKHESFSINFPSYPDLPNIYADNNAASSSIELIDVGQQYGRVAEGYIENSSLGEFVTEGFNATWPSVETCQSSPDQPEGFIQL